MFLKFCFNTPLGIPYFVELIFIQENSKIPVYFLLLGNYDWML